MKKVILSLCFLCTMSLGLMAQQIGKVDKNTSKEATTEIISSQEMKAVPDTDGKEVKACCSAKKAEASTDNKAKITSEVAEKEGEVKACCAAKVAQAEAKGEEPKACCVAKMAQAEAGDSEESGEKKACCSAKKGR